MFPTKVARSAKPKLSLSISTQVAPVAHHAPITPVGSFVSTSSRLSPTSRNTRANQRSLDIPTGYVCLPTKPKHEEHPPSGELIVQLYVGRKESRIPRGAHGVLHYTGYV